MNENDNAKTKDHQTLKRIREYIGMQLIAFTIVLFVLLFLPSFQFVQLCFSGMIVIFSFALETVDFIIKKKLDKRVFFLITILVFLSISNFLEFFKIF